MLIELVTNDSSKQ